MAKRLMEEARDVFRSLHYSYRTEVTYLKWIRRFIKYNDNRHPRDLRPADRQNKGPTGRTPGLGAGGAAGAV